MNIVDASLTWHWVSSGVAEELNPIMDYALQTSPFLFFGSKIILTGLGCLLLWRLREHRMARICGAALAGVYLAIMTCHGLIAADLYSLAAFPF